MPQIKEAIDRMSTAERVQVLEYLWSVLASHYEREVPAWHAEILAARAQAPDEEFEDWDAVKRELRGDVLAH